MGKLRILLLIVALGAVCQVGAQQQSADKPLRPVTAAYSIEFGSAHVVDTYLSPLKYTGYTVAFSYDRLQAMKFNPEKWIMNLNLQVGLDHTENPARNATIWGAGIAARWGMMRRISTETPVKLAIGGSTGLNLGAFYTTRNGNNPVAAKASWTINLSAMASWNTRLGKIPVTLAYRPTLPLTGLFFSQAYGELYYEIYLGDRSGLVHGAWPGNYFALDNLATVDFRFGATSLRIGYHNTIVSTKVSDITTRLTSNSISVGVAGEWISLAPGKSISEKTKTISAFY